MTAVLTKMYIVVANPVVTSDDKSTKGEEMW